MATIYGTILDVCLCRNSDQIRFIQVNQGFTHDDIRYRIGDILDITRRPNGDKCIGLWVANLFNTDDSDIELAYLPGFVKGNFTKFDISGSMTVANESELRYERPVPPPPSHPMIKDNLQRHSDTVQGHNDKLNYHHQQQENIELEEDNKRYILNYRPVPLPPKSQPPIFNETYKNESESSRIRTRNHVPPWMLNNNNNSSNNTSNPNELRKTRLRSDRSSVSSSSSSSHDTGSSSPNNVDIYKLNEMRYMNERSSRKGAERPLPPRNGPPPTPPPTDYAKPKHLIAKYNANVADKSNTAEGIQQYGGSDQLSRQMNDIDFTSNTPLFPRGSVRSINGRTASPMKPTASMVQRVDDKITKAKIPEATKTSLVSFLKKIGCYDELLRKKFLYLENTCQEEQLLEDFHGNEVCGRVIYHFMYRGWRPNLKPPQYWKERPPPSYSVAELYLYMMWKGYQVLGRFLKSVCVDGPLMCHVLKDRILFQQLLPNGHRLNEGQLLDLRKDFVVAYPL